MKYNLDDFSRTKNRYGNITDPEDLKPCPFCRKSDIKIRIYQCKRPGWEMGWNPKMYCSFCGISFGFGWFGWGFDPDDIEKDIVRRWNMRKED